MKNVKRLLVLLLFVNCTTDSVIIEERPEVSVENLDAQTCVSDSPKVRLTNNGTDSFEFTVYAQDYTVLYTQIISSATDSGWIELSQNDVLIVAYNTVVYGQKIPLNLELCDNLELEIDTNNVLGVTGD